MMEKAGMASAKRMQLERGHRVGTTEEKKRHRYHESTQEGKAEVAKPKPR